MKKTTFRILSAAVIAAGFAFASCDSDAILEKGSQNHSDKSRVIAVSFQNDLTKTELDTDGLTPKFKANDQIRVSNGSAFEDCTVEVNGGVATISTELEGPLTAVYPSTAAKMNESNTNQIDGIQVPTVQNGTFASANICKATIEEGATSATFVNQTAVFKITPATGATYVEVIAPHGKELADYVPEGSTYNCDSYHKIRVPVTSGEAVYVSVLVPESLSLKSITFASDCGIKTPASTDALAVNSLYTVTAENWTSNNTHPYVEIGGLKWATMNVGATFVATCHCLCYGDYFAWGETAPYYSSMTITSASTATFTWKDGKSSGYRWQSYCGSDYFTEWSTPPYDATSKNLTSSYDAATVNWGSGWRMPTSGEFTDLNNACNSTWLTSDQNTYPEYTGVAGRLFIDKNDNSKRVFFPATGYVSGSSFKSGGSYSNVWSSSLYTLYPNYARDLGFHSGNVNPSDLTDREYGFTLRPVSE